MQQLVERFDETCDLGVFDRGWVLYVEVVRSKHSLTIAARVGRRLRAYCTASGRVFLAFLPPEVVEPVLSEPLMPCTAKTTTSLSRLREECRRPGSGGMPSMMKSLSKGSAPFPPLSGILTAM
jgi:DNA-binding IclR family transcriptional regulator